ncbi:MAG: hypothetical protein N2053_03870, partial [Chitinispirillaceae bacterium]|nr:hypothetical protein [Chitinispirillaceae bacterium]
MKKVVTVVSVMLISLLSCDSYQNILITEIIGVKITPNINNPHKPPKENIIPQGQLVLWNKMDGKEGSVVGYNCKYYGGKFVEGKFGKAYMGTLSEGDYATFPKEVIPLKEGCIEFWAKIEGFSGVIPWGGTPIFFHTSLDSQEFILHFNGNDGEGNGGI